MSTIVPRTIDLRPKPSGGSTSFNPWSLLKKTVLAWIENRQTSTSAALAYYSLFSLAPILLIAISLAGIFYGPEAVQGHILYQFEGLLGKPGAALLQDMIKSSYFSTNNLKAIFLGAGGMLVGATAVFAELSSAFNRIFKQERKYRYAWVSTIMERLHGLVLVIGMGFLIITSLVASSVITGISTWLSSFSGATALLLTALQAVISLTFMSILFAMMMRIMAPVRMSAIVLLLGGMCTAVLFELGKWALGLYLGQSAVGSAFGAAGTLAVLLVWLNYASMIVLFGVELTNQLHQQRSATQPEKTAAQETGKNG